MSLRVGSLELRDFRSYRSFSLKEIGDLTIIVGPNAAGKTNIVEAIQLLSAITSFRHPTVEQLIRHGEQSSRIAISLEGDDRRLDVALDIHDRSKRYSVNGKHKNAVELKGLMPSVTFTPDDLELVKGSMSLRRRALDTLGSQLSPNHHMIRRDYEKVIAHKNRLLKEEASELMLDSIDEMIVRCGATLSAYRLSLFNRLLPYVIEMYEDIAGGKDELCGSYSFCWEDTPKFYRHAGETEVPTKDQLTDFLYEALRKKRGEERTRKRALVGPHTDEINFTVNGYDASQFASQGQQRSLVLSQKLAEIHVIEDVLGKKPLLLLDDVMSELDEQRRSALVKHLFRDAQSFITTANLAYFDEDILERARVVDIGI